MELLGDGSSSQVLKRKKNGNLIAVKKSKSSSRFDSQFRHEIEFLRYVGKHHRFPRLLGYNKNSRLRYINELEMSLCPGQDLFAVLSARDAPLSKCDVKVIMRQVFHAIHFLHHDKKMVHGDLKIENVMIDEATLEIKIVDLGKANLIADPKADREVGTESYAPPETVTNQFERKAAPMEMFTCGTMMYCMLMNQGLPMKTTHQIWTPYIDVTNTLTRFSEIFPTSTPLYHLVSSLLCEDPKQRLTSEQAIHHPWFFETKPAPIHSLKRKRSDYI